MKSWSLKYEWMAPKTELLNFSIVVILEVLRYKCRLSSRNSVSPPSAAAIADSVIGNGVSGFTGPTTSKSSTIISYPPSALSSGLAVPWRISDDSIRADLMFSKRSSPNVSLLATHWIEPVESRSTIKRILFEPLERLTQPFNSTLWPSYLPSKISEIQIVFISSPATRSRAHN